MKILFDHQAFCMQRRGGISRYYVEIMTRLSARSDLEIAAGILFSSNEHLLESSLVWRRPPPPAMRSPAMVRRLNKIAGAWALLRGAPDVFHPTYYSPYFLPFLGATPFVLTIYDMIHERFPEVFVADQVSLSRSKRILAERATRIIAISESTKQDIVNFYGIAPGKVTSIHLANSLASFPPAPLPPGIPTPYFLFVGNRRGYKNFALLARAFSRLRPAQQLLHLVCAGGPAFTEDEKALFVDLGIAGHVVWCAADDRTLSALYHSAIGFVFPSLCEGFGLPLLEAFGCDCPVIAADIPVFREVAGDALLAFDPLDEFSLHSALERVLRDPTARERMIARGRERATMFSWDRCAEQTLNVYRELA